MYGSIVLRPLGPGHAASLEFDCWSQMFALKIDIFKGSLVPIVRDSGADFYPCSRIDYLRVC